MGSSNSDPIMVLSGDSSDDYMSSDEESESFTFRGPRYKGTKEFDKQCLFGNGMYMTEDQVSFLEDWCDADAPQIKYYVFQMTKSSVLPKKCKMEFGAEFTRRYLKDYLDEPVDVHVEWMGNKKKLTVRMKMGVGSSKAIMTSGWDNVVKRYKIHEEDIVLFNFHAERDGNLFLLLVDLPQPCFLG